MVKSFKKGLAMVLAAAMVFSTPIAVNKTVASAGTLTLPTPLYYFDFEDGSLDNAGSLGGTAEIVGGGATTDTEADGGFFDNASDAELATKTVNYLSLPNATGAAVAINNAESQAMTFSTEIKLVADKYSVWSPVFGFDSTSNPASWPCLALELRGTAALNSAGWFNGDNSFSDATFEKLSTEKWATLTIVLDGNTGEGGTIYTYIDDTLINTTDVQAFATDDNSIKGILSGPDGDTYFQGVDRAMLGAGQPFWNDPDAQVLYDNVRLYNEALSADQIALLAEENAKAPVEKVKYPESLIGYYTFDDTLQNEVAVSGGAATAIGNKLAAPADEDFEYVEGKNGKAINFKGGTSNGLLLDVAPTNKEYTISFNVNYQAETQFAATALLYGGRGDDSDALWASIGQGWKSSLSLAPMVWSRDVLYGNAWNDLVPATGNEGTVEVGTWANITVVSTGTTGTIYVNGEEIGTGNIADVVSGCETGELKTYLGVNAWDSTISAYMDDVAIYNAALSEDDVVELAKNNGNPAVPEKTKLTKDFVKNANVALSEDGASLVLTFEKGDDVTDEMNCDSIKVTLRGKDEPIAADDDISFEDGVATVNYIPTEAGTYDFVVTASKKGDDTTTYRDDTEKVSIKIVEDNGVFYTTDSSLIETALAIGQTDEAFTITYKVAEGATAALTVKDSSNKEVAVADGKVKKSALKDGETYTVDLKVTKGTTIATAKDTFTYNAPKQAEATSKWAKIKTQPLLFWEFNSATENGMKLTGASIAKTSDGNNVLQLGKDVGIQHESYAQLPSLTSYDFSKGMTVTMDVNVTGWTDNGWTKFFVFGNGTLGKDPVAGEVAYGYTLGLNNVLDYDDWNHKTGYYGTGVAIDKGTELGAETAPLGTSDLQLVWDWYSNTAKQNRWDTITITVSPDGTLSTYYDGTLVQQYKNADFTMILDSMKKATTNYLGTSYYPDPDYVGQMDNFAIYNTALSAADVKTLTGDVVADKTETVDSGTDPGTSKTGTKAAPSFMDGPTVSKNRKKITAEFSVKPTKVTESTGKGTVKISGKKVTITYKSALKLGTKVKVTAYNDTASKSKTVTVKGTITIKNVKAKKNTKKVTGKLSVKKATVKVRIKYKGKKKYTKYKKAKVSGKKFTFKAKKMKKGTKVQIKVTKKNYKTKTKTVKVK